MPESTTTIDESRVEAFVYRIIDEIAAAMNVPLSVIGFRLGLYKAMADGEPVTSAELAERTGTDERYVREWLAGQGAGGYVEYDPETETYRLPIEHAAVLADENSPVYQGGMFQSASAAMLAQDHVAERFVTGDGLGWHEHHHDLFDGTARCSASPTRPCWCRSGSRRSRASRRSSSAARWWPTSAAATGSRRS